MWMLSAVAALVCCLSAGISCANYVRKGLLPDFILFVLNWCFTVLNGFFAVNGYLG